MHLPLCVRVEDEQSISALKADGWQEIEILEIWEGDVGHASEVVIPAKLRDLGFCQQLASESFSFDRLHKDAKVSKADADQFKSNFVMFAFNCQKYEIFIIPEKGFVIFDENTISLIAVNEDHRNRGLGMELARAKGGMVTAGTQNTNYKARMLYRALGMEKIREMRSYHKWL